MEVKSLNIIVSNSSDKPIYEQIYLQIKNHILSGELKEEEMLPSMRFLAKELRISVITTKRAYEELERDGFIVSMVGKGSFVKAKNVDFLREEHLRRTEEYLRKFIGEGQLGGLTLEELQEMLALFYEEEIGITNYTGGSKDERDH